MTWHSGQIRTVVNWACPKCGDGNMRYTGEEWPTDPPGYHHQCDRCEHAAVVRLAKFPVMELWDDLL